MKNRSILPLIQPLLTRLSFTIDEAKKLGISAAHLGYYVKIGQIKRLSRGIYQGSHYKGCLENFQWEELIEMAYAIPNGVICLMSALAVYGITDEIPRKHWIAVSHHTSIRRGPKVKIIRFRNIKLGQTTIWLANISIPIFDLERTIIDAFRLLTLEIAIKALKMALDLTGPIKLDLRKLQAYGKALKFNITPYLMTVTT